MPAAMDSTTACERGEVWRGGARCLSHVLRLDGEDNEIGAGDRRGVALRMDDGTGKARRQLVALRRIRLDEAEFCGARAAREHAPREGGAHVAAADEEGG